VRGWRKVNAIDSDSQQQMVIWRSLSPLVLARVMELLMTRKAAGVAHAERPPSPVREDTGPVRPQGSG
jgi:hypothetical protein